MADLDRDKEASSPVGITGGDEQYIADVIEEFGIRKLRVKSDTNISSDLEILSQFNVNQAISNTTWTTIFSRNAPTNISGIIARFSKEKLRVRLLIDGNEIFNVKLEDLRSLVDLQGYAVPDGIYLKYKSDIRTFFYVPRFPQDATVDIVFQAQNDPGEDGQFVSGIFQVS